MLGQVLLLAHNNYNNNTADDAADLVVILSSESSWLHKYASNEATKQGTLLYMLLLNKVLCLSPKLSVEFESNKVLCLSPKLSVEFESKCKSCAKEFSSTNLATEPPDSGPLLHGTPSNPNQTTFHPNLARILHCLAFLLPRNNWATNLAWLSGRLIN